MHFGNDSWNGDELFPCKLADIHAATAFICAPIYSSTIRSADCGATALARLLENFIWSLSQPFRHYSSMITRSLEGTAFILERAWTKRRKT